MSALADFHLLRPMWLLALAPALLLILLYRRGRPELAWRRAIAPHLLPHLLMADRGNGPRLRPVHLLTLFWLLAAVALAGPTWQRDRSPFSERRAPLILALHTGAGMLARDIQPSRLERAVQKIGDLLDRLAGGPAALVAYAGTAHLVMPLTTDHRLIRQFAAELSPAIMPEAGNDTAAAVRLGLDLLAQAGSGGSMLLITDSVTPSGLESLETALPVDILAMATPPGAAPAPAGPPGPALDRAALQAAARALGGELVLATVNDDDVAGLARRLDRRPTGLVPGEQQRWQDAGYYLLLPMALIVLLWFRRGWTVAWYQGS